MSDIWTTPAVRLAAVRNSLHPTEQRVADLIQSDPLGVVESTAQQLADRLGVARSSVVRTCQKLGYRGYPQLRVALARQVAVTEPQKGREDDALSGLRGEVVRLAGLLPDSLGLLTNDVAENAVEVIATSRRVLCVANGLSGPLALDLAMRLTATGRIADYVSDALGQQISARQLTSDDAVIVISGSGANDVSLRTAKAANRAGAKLIAVTSFVSSPLVEVADVVLVIASVHDSFRSELEHTSRIAHAVFLHALIPLIAERQVALGRNARAGVLEVLAENLTDWE